jgi:phage head maturation protease
MSFAFRVRPNGEKVTITMQGEMELEERELLDLDLQDVSIVCWPAYTQTDVAIRSLAEVRDRPRPKHTPRRNRAERLLRLADVV